MKDKTVYQLATRLNELMLAREKLEMDILKIDKEYDAIVYELWERIPSLKKSSDIQPKRRKQ